MPYHHREDHFRTEDGLQLRYQIWLPQDSEVRRSLVVHHGFGEHSDRYGNLREGLDHTGTSFYSFDMRGHGLSEGPRGSGNSVELFVSDLDRFLNVLREQHNIIRPLLLGHSLGALLSLAFTLKGENQNKIQGLITSAAPLKVDMTPAMRMKWILGHILQFLAPGMRIKAGLPTDYLSHDPRLVNSYKTDPLIHGYITSPMAMDVIRTGEELLRTADRMRIPLYMMHGEEDRIANPISSREFFHNASSSHKELRIYPHLYHELFNEPPEQRTPVLQQLKEWILALPEQG